MSFGYRRAKEVEARNDRQGEHGCCVLEDVERVRAVRSRMPALLAILGLNALVLLVVATVGICWFIRRRKRTGSSNKIRRGGRGSPSNASFRDSMALGASVSGETDGITGEVSLSSDVSIGAMCDIGGRIRTSAVPV